MEQIMRLAESFFKELGCNLLWKGETLHVSNVPEEFESFAGKKSPYILAFSQVDNPDAEIMTKGSFLLKAMNSYLETKGTTALIRLNFERDYKEEFKHHFKLRNSDIHSLTKKQSYYPIIRFTFITNLQYLNEKESLINDIYIKDGKQIDFSIDSYSQSAGNKEDIPKLSLKDSYSAAKDSLKPLLANRISEASELLNKRLTREQQRIKDHYSIQRKELSLAIQKIRNQIEQNEKLANASSPEIQAKISKLKESLSSLESGENFSKIEKEENFFLLDELHKHSLNINNKLMNTSVICCPIFNFSILLKSNESARQIELEYDPVSDILSPEVVCEVCKREIREIFLCSSGHINCNNCFDKCRECLGGLCSLCIKKSCDYCSRKLCKKCSNSCSICFKPFCQSHLKINYLTGKPGCINCLKSCSSCGKYAPASKLRILSDKDICEQCFRMKKLNSRT